MMSIDDWLKVAELVFVLFQAIFLLVLFLLRRTFASKEDVAGARERADNAHHRLDVLEERLKGFPDYDTINEIKNDIVEIKEGLATGNAEMRMTRETVGRIDDFLRHSK